MLKKQTNSIISEKGKIFKSLLQKFLEYRYRLGGGHRGEVHFNQIKILIKKNNNNKNFNCFQPT